MENPFKFVSLVDTPYFTDRVKEVDYIVQFLKSENHLVLMSPQRFGKSSLVKNGYHIVLLKIKWLNYAKLRSYHSTYTLHTPFPVSYHIHSEHTRTHYNVGQTLSNQDYEDSHPIGCL